MDGSPTCPRHSPTHTIPTASTVALAGSGRPTLGQGSSCASVRVSSRTPSLTPSSSPAPGARPAPHTTSRGPAGISAPRPGHCQALNGPRRERYPRAGTTVWPRGRPGYHRPPTRPPAHRVPGLRSHTIRPRARRQRPRHSQPCARPSGRLPRTLEGICGPAGFCRFAVLSARSLSLSTQRAGKHGAESFRATPFAPPW